MHNIRLATIFDAPNIAFLFDQYRQFYKQLPNIALAESFISQRLNNQESVIFLAESDDKKAIGFCQIYPSFCSLEAAKIGVLYDLFIEFNARKTGAGRALILAAHDYATKNNLKRLDLTTAKDNYAAQTMYESLGWTKDTVFYAYSKEIK